MRSFILSQCRDCQIVLIRLAKSSTLVGQQRQNTGRRRLSVYVGWRTSQSPTNGVDADRRRRRVVLKNQLIRLRTLAEEAFGVTLPALKT